MSEYTYKNLIIDPRSEEAKTCIGKRVYYSSNPASCLQYANDHDMECCKVLKGINPDSIYPFTLEDSNIFCSCIILCEEEPEPEYVPFESKNEFVRAYQKFRESIKYDTFENNLADYGIWVKNKNGISCAMVIEIWDEGVALGGETQSIYWQDLFEYYTFPDGSPCGKLKENK